MERAAFGARHRQCRSLKIETQNTNVPACRFYAACGCRLGGVHPGAYADLPDEVMLLWYLDLSVPDGEGSWVADYRGKATNA